ncbi:hypothetical protein [uncultured Dysgonomonas sp.]|uniref:Uncharacterized protein n=1 Tax=uncultured Dysgonomonas sp. TaxID=206096 RepID=A0A212JFQ6_9BACT|nr:hypothetical protein [uncultured Dysgonomonas sp.]SBV98241.1 conserved membrane hypothetical protein [uncultured Dysgonomonas sp.]
MKTKLIKLDGILLILLAIFHLSFWELFNWQEELPKLSDTNSGIMQISTIGFASILFPLGIILIRYCIEIANTKLGKALLLALSFFFLIRTIVEYIFPGSSIELGVFLFLCTLLFLVPALH